MTKKRQAKARRYRQARSDARVGSVERDASKVYGLTLRVVDGRGRDVRSDAKVKTVRKKKSN